MHSKKGFLTSQVLIYAFGLIILILIIFTGYKAIISFFSAADTSGFNTLSAKFSSDMASLSLRKDEIKKFTYSIPQGYQKFCVFDFNNNINVNSSIFSSFPYLKTLLNNKRENIFFLDDNYYFSFRNDELKISGYPYYYCVDIKTGSISFSAKGDVINGQHSASILASSKVEVDITAISLPSGSGRELISSLDLISSDGLAKIVIPLYTVIRMPGANTSLYIEVNEPGESSDIYSFGPRGTRFSPKIKIGLEKSDCELRFNSYFFYGIRGESCENGFVIFSVSEI